MMFKVNDRVRWNSPKRMFWGRVVSINDREYGGNYPIRVSFSFHKDVCFTAEGKQYEDHEPNLSKINF